MTFGKTQGTGLGLSSAKNILEQYNGSISIQTEEGKGTSVLIRIPFQNFKTDTARISATTHDQQI